MTLAAHHLELLAPARTAEIGVEAVNHGADAVYIGGPGFGARSNADNSVADIARLVEHAHRFRAKIFVAFNTILRDDELEPARRMAWQMHEAGVDALIVQDMGLLEIDMPPLQLHASTQCDIRTPEKARFLQDVGFAQIVLARELTLSQIAAIRTGTDSQRCALEFFIHGALCVAYSGQCYISHAQTGRSANRGDCSQACRLPYTVSDAAGRIVAHDKHVLSMKDNNQSDNLRALIDAGVRSFKIEGRYKDMGYVKNITAYYRKLLDQILDERPELARASSGRCTFTFEPDPEQNFNRGATDYFVNGRQFDIGAFDTPKHAGSPIGWVTRIGRDCFDAEVEVPLSNGDGFTWYDLQRELTGMPANRVEPLHGQGADASGLWRIWPKEPVAALKDLRAGAELHRNRDMRWVRRLERKSAERRIGLWATLEETADGFALSLTDEEGVSVTVGLCHGKEAARETPRAHEQLREQLGRFGNTIFSAHDIALKLSGPWFIRASTLNALRREALAALEAARAAGYQRPPRLTSVEPPTPYPDDALSYLANVFNHRARDFYAKHGVRLIDAAYESHEEAGDVSLMITKHCVRYSLSLCPKQAKGVTGVQGTVRAEPLTLVHNGEKLTLRFDCKPCEMHVVGRIRKSILKQEPEAPLRFYRQRPGV